MAYSSTLLLLFYPLDCSWLLGPAKIEGWSRKVTICSNLQSLQLELTMRSVEVDFLEWLVELICHSKNTATFSRFHVDLGHNPRIIYSVVSTFICHYSLSRESLRVPQIGTRVNALILSEQGSPRMTRAPRERKLLMSHARRTSGDWLGPFDREENWRIEHNGRFVLCPNFPPVNSVVSSCRFPNLVSNFIMSSATRQRQQRQQPSSAQLDAIVSSLLIPILLQSNAETNHFGYMWCSVRLTTMRKICLLSPCFGIFSNFP